jgi:hypothetical protein
MSPALFELDQISQLPLWAQVLLASRMVRRAALSLGERLADAEGQRRLAGCDALDRATLAGSWSQQRQALETACAGSVGRHGREVAEALRLAADAAHAATDATDFEAAERACCASARRAMDEACRVYTFTPLQARILLAADFDLIRFSCGEARIGRYDALTADVLQRLVPVRAPEHTPPEPQPSPEDLAR